MRRVVDLLLEAGYSLSVNDGEEWTLVHSLDADAVMTALRTTDEDRLVAHGKSGRRVGAVYFVYGNMPCEVVADNSTSLNDVLIPLDAFCAEIEASF